MVTRFSNIIFLLAYSDDKLTACSIYTYIFKNAYPPNNAVAYRHGVA